MIWCSNSNINDLFVLTFALWEYNKSRYNHYEERWSKTMTTITLDDKEVELLKNSINHCLKTCKQGSAEHGCQDCQALEAVLAKLSA